MKSNERILIVAPSWIGDLIISQSLFKQLKLINRDCVIDVVIRSNLIPIVNKMPQINRKLALDVPHGSLGIFHRYRLAKELKNYSYQKAYILTNSFKSAIIPWLANIPIRVGYLGEMRYGLINKRFYEKKFEISMVNRFLKLADSFYKEDLLPELVLNEAEKKEVILKFDIDLSKKNIFLCPDAEYGPAKRWPSEKWYELARMFDALGYKIYFLGKSNLGFNNLSTLPNVTSLINRTTIEETIHLLSTADLVVSNDSGLMHVASSVNAKILAIFGSTSPKYTPPLSKNGYSKIAYHNVDCSPCFKRTCPYGHLKCLKEIGVDEIMAEAGNLL